MREAGSGAGAGAPEGGPQWYAGGSEDAFVPGESVGQSGGENVEADS